MSNKQWKTPDDYFDSLEASITNKLSGDRVKRRRFGSWAVAAGLAIGLLVGYGWELRGETSCETFACLLEKTSPEELPMDQLLESALVDDELFELLLEDLPENWNE